MTNSISQPFFILGCQRCGSTLLRLILESHPDISCIDEYTSYESLTDLNKLSENYKNKLLGFKTPLITEQMDKPFFTDVTLDYIIPNKFADYPRIFLIRDVRDTIVSMKSLKVNNTTWYDKWPQKSLEFWRQTIPNFDSNFSEDLLKISNSNDKLLATASFYWKYKNRSYFDYEQNDSKTCKIFYEDLVENPKNTIQKIIDFLDVDWNDNLLNHHMLKHDYTDKKGITVGNTNTKSPIFKTSVKKFSKKLNDQELDNILSISGDLMTDLGYKI